VPDHDLPDLCRDARRRELRGYRLQAFDTHGRALGRNTRRALVGVEPGVVDRDRSVAGEILREREVIGGVPSLRLGHTERDRAEGPAPSNERNADRRRQTDPEEDRFFLPRKSRAADEVAGDLGKERRHPGAQHLRQPVRRRPIALHSDTELSRPGQLVRVTPRNGNAPDDRRPGPARVRVYDVDGAPVGQRWNRGVGYLLQNGFVVQGLGEKTTGLGEKRSAGMRARCRSGNRRRSVRGRHALRGSGARLTAISRSRSGWRRRLVEFHERYNG
jgi:hypothetical protein